MGMTTDDKTRLGYGSSAAEFYKYDKFLWLVEIGLRPTAHGPAVTHSLHGPFCSREGCRAQMDLTVGNEATPASYKCVICSKDYSYKNSHSELRKRTLLSYEAKSRENWPIVALDQPPTDLHARDEDSKYWIATRIGIKNAKRVGVVYFGEKKRHQSQKDYSQIFIDMDDEQIRHDPSNMNPNEIISRIEVEFKGSKTKKEIKD